MSTIDRSVSAGMDPGGFEHASSRHIAGRRSREISETARGTREAGAAAGSFKTEAQQKTAEVLDVIADSVMQRRMHNIHVLTASVTKFLLTSLEPAMQFAMDLRDQAEAQPQQSVEVASDDRRNEALAVLGDARPA